VSIAHWMIWARRASSVNVHTRWPLELISDRTAKT